MMRYRHPAAPIGATLRHARRVRGMKQAHAAECLDVTQPIISRIERGEFEPSGRLRAKILDLVTARLDPARDTGLRRLVEHAQSPVHLICDITHRLLAASSAREREWQRSFSELRGCSLWPYASEAIQVAEARLSDLGWGEHDGSHTLTFVTTGNRSMELRIAPGTLTWDRVILADGAPARIVTRHVRSGTG